MDGIIAADMKGNIFIFNKGAEALTGYTAEEVIGKSPYHRDLSEGVAKDIMKKLRSPEYGGIGKLNPSQLNLVRNKTARRSPSSSRRRSSMTGPARRSRVWGFLPT